jgi:folate-binding protein YgfZ
MDAYAKSVSQVAAARGSVLAVRDDDGAVLVVTGKDRVSWLNGLMTCDLLKGGPGEARYGLVVVRSGKVLADAVVVSSDESTLLAVKGTLRAGLRAHLDHHLVMEDAEISPDAAFEVWALHGPRSGDVLRAARAAGAAGGVVDRTGLGGAIVLAAAEHAGAVAAAIRSAVQAAGGAVGDAEGWEALRLERGLPRFGVDFDEKMYPQEASLERVAVSFDKGCYLGQEVVCMLEMRGHVKRRLVPIVLEGDGVPLRGAAVTDESGASVGEVTSAAASPTLRRPVALALLKRAQAEPGQTVLVGGRRAEVVQRPA